MRFLIAFVALLVACPALAETVVTTTTITITTAQTEAEGMARTGILRHCGRNGGRAEGIGFSTVSADHAIRNSCYWGQRKPREIGVARGPRGWYACVRYW
jgi:hypothetical protein